jgi:hypothetical protein
METIKFFMRNFNATIKPRALMMKMRIKRINRVRIELMWLWKDSGEFISAKTSKKLYNYNIFQIPIDNQNHWQTEQLKMGNSLSQEINP